jgi:O-antigen/teichoic acid export membrane protein
VQPLAEPEPTAGTASATTARTLLSGGLWSTAARVIPQLYTLVLLVAAARFLGAERLGRQSFIAFVELSVVMLATAGMPTALMRYVGETLGRGEGGAVRGLVAWAWRIEAVAAAVGGGILGAAATLGADPAGAWILAAVATTMGILHTVPSSLLIGAQRWREAALAGLVTGTVATPATVAVLAAGGGITGMFAVEACASVAILAWTAALARRATHEVAPLPAPSDELRGKVVRYAGFASVGVVLTFVVWRRSEFFFLERFSTYTQIALYSIAFSLVNALSRLFEAVIAVVTPAVATLYGAGEHDRIRRGYARAMRLLALATLPVSAVVIAVGPETVRLLGSDFGGTGRILVLMMLTFPVVPLVKSANGLLHGLGRIRFILVAGAFAAVVNVALDVILIPPYEAVGAALANGGAQVAAAVPVLVYSSRILGGVDWQLRFLLRGAFAATGTGLAAWGAVSAVGGGPGVALGLVAGLAALVALAPLVRFLPPGDAAWLAQLAGNRLGGTVGRAIRLCASRRGEPPLPPLERA